MVHEKLKGEVNNMVTDAEKSAEILSTGTVIPECNTFRLSVFLGDTSEARGAAGVLVKVLPDDSEVKKIWARAARADATAFRARDKFIEACVCKKK